jgi:hypothetical protein
MTFETRQLTGAFTHKPEMPNWASDDVNNLIDLLYDSLQVHFVRLKCTERRAISKKAFRNHCNIIKRMFGRFSQLLWKPDVESRRPEREWLDKQSVAIVIREELSIMARAHDGTAGIPARARIHEFELTSEEAECVVSEVSILWYFSTSAKDLSEEDAWRTARASKSFNLST